ncbi:MAG: sugar phosphate isomerase/epimerase family protein [Bacteroidia bacterium]|nr:sugar phosphate isomerase/epimerase family protein [Bacteroidia bacterium]
MDRKSFLKQAALGLGSASLLLNSCQTAQAEKASENSTTEMPVKAGKGLTKKSLKWGMIQEEISVMEKFKLVKELGFDGIELDSPNDLDEVEVLEAKEASGLEIPGVVNSVHWKKPLSHPDAAVRAECAASMETALKACKRYGGTTVLLVAGVVNDDISYADAYKRSQDEIRKLLPIAKETGIKIAIENVWNNFLISPVEAARYIDEFESDMIGWYFDVGNIVRYGWPHHWVEALGHRIMKVDIKEYSRKKQTDEGIWKGFNVELGEGNSDWEKVNAALKKVGYTGWGSAEMRGGDRERLADISRRMDDVYSR